MRSGHWAALVAGAAVVSAAIAGVARAAPEGRGDSEQADETCELARVDRARTPARACLSCHDGSVAASSIPAPTLGTSHPVGIDYAAARARAPDRYAAALPADLPLVDGRIACTTCHDGAATDRYRLARPATGPLCLACHQL